MKTIRQHKICIKVEKMSNFIGEYSLLVVTLKKKRRKKIENVFLFQSNYSFWGFTIK